MARFSATEGLFYLSFLQPTIPQSSSMTAPFAQGSLLTKSFYAFLLFEFLSSAKPLFNHATMAWFSVSAFRQPRAKHETDNHPLCGWATRVIPMCYNEGLRTQSLPQRWKLPSLCERADAPLRVGRGGPTELVDEENPHNTAQAGFSSSVVLTADTFPAGEGILLCAFAKQKPATPRRWLAILGF